MKRKIEQSPILPSVKLSITKRSFGQWLRMSQIWGPALLCLLFAAPTQLPAQSFDSYRAGDDVTTSLGQFQIVLDQAWVKIFDLIMANSPLATTAATRHLKIYRH